MASRLASHTRWLLTLPVLFALLVGAPACAALRAQAAQIDLPGARLGDVAASVAPGTDGTPHLILRAGHVAVPALGWKDAALDLAGTLSRPAAQAWRVDGTLSVAHAPGNALSDANFTLIIDADAGSFDITLDQRNTNLRVLMPLDQPTHLQLTLRGVPLTWLQGVLAAAWNGGRATAGSLSGEIALDHLPQDLRMSGRVALTNAGIDSHAGTIAAQKLGAAGVFRLDVGQAVTQLDFDGSLGGGEALLGPLYAQLPAHPAALQFGAHFDAHGIAVDGLRFDDNDSFSTHGSLALDARGNLAALKLAGFDARLPAAYTRYGTTLLAAEFGLANLQTSGRVAGSIALGRNGPDAFRFEARNLSFAAADGSLAAGGVNGTLDWDARAVRPATTLGWRSLALDKLPIGAAQAHFASDGGALTLRQPVEAGLFGGEFLLQRLQWRPAAAQTQRLDAGFAVSNVDLAAVCKVFGWPAFGGTLGGAVPSLSYQGDQLVFDGGLSMHVFDGTVDVTSLSMQHPFGTAPTLAADIDMRQLDLTQLTSVFDFGQITGRLDGKIVDLHLIDWKPVAFDAVLQADSGGKISQRAIKSLAEVGGGGIAAGLQGAMLRMFQNFGYSRIGLRCKLANGVCVMGGIEPLQAGTQDNGYTIVDGSGLPHISVIGHQNQVDWPTLVDRLKAATEGQGPVIR